MGCQRRDADEPLIKWAALADGRGGASLKTG